MLLPGHVPDEKGEVTCPDLAGGTNFWPPSFDPATRTFFVNAREVCMTFYRVEARIHRRASGSPAAPGSACRASESPAYGALRAIDPTTGERKWEFKFLSPSTSGILTTASGLLFSGDADGNLLALDSRSGKLLWRYQMGATLHGTSPTTYMIDGRQHLLVPSGTTLTAWALQVERRGELQSPDSRRDGSLDPPEVLLNRLRSGPPSAINPTAMKTSAGNHTPSSHGRR